MSGTGSKCDLMSEQPPLVFSNPGLAVEEYELKLLISDPQPLLNQEILYHKTCSQG